MGYWHGYENYADYFGSTHPEMDYPKCVHCNTPFLPNSPRQKYCSREDNPACDDDRYFEKLWEKGKHPLQLIQQ